MASATFKTGENAGMPVPLHCTWYNITSDQNEFVKIPDVSGSCYQPSVEDIGSKVVVHAIPASDLEEYQGMPLYQEAGPLVMDPAVATQVSHFSQQNPVLLGNVILEAISHPRLAPQPKQLAIVLRIQPHQVSLAKKLHDGDAKRQSSNANMDDLIEPETLVEVPYCQDFKVTVVRNVSNILLLDSTEQQFSAQIQLTNNVERDVATLLMRLFSQKFLEAPQVIKQLSEKDFYRKKEEIWSNQLLKL